MAVVLTVLGALVLSAVVVAAPAAARGRSVAERQAANAVLSTLNAERRVHGLPALAPNYQLIVAAWRHDLAMASRNTLSHRLTGEPDLGTRITRAGYAWTRCAENIAYTSAMTPSGAVAMQRSMYGERAPYDSHRLTILSRSYREVGVAAYLDTLHHELWLTLDFGHR